MILIKILNYIYDRFIDILLPARCFVSGDLVDQHGTIAPHIWKDLSFITKPYCDQCSKVFEFEVEGRTVCLQCQEDPPYFDQARAAIRYDDVSKRIVLSFKYADQTHSAPILARWMIQAGRDLLEEADVIIPVPLHFFRLLSRRYNQAALLAKAISKEYPIATHVRALKRDKNTPSQGHKKIEQRRQNVKNAFYVDENYKKIIEGKNIVLIDDVLTTGSTMNECAKVLKQAGAKKVTLLCLARA